MQNKIILFDIDYTLWDTKIYRQQFYRVISEKCLIENRYFIEEAEKLYRDHIDKFKYFSPDIFAAKLISHFSLNIKQEELLKIILDKNIFVNALYPNIEKTLEKLKKRGYTSGIFSRGRLVFQAMKIEVLKNHFDEDHIYILEEKDKKIKKIIDKYRDYELFMVDDLPKILNFAKKTSSKVTTIWIKQGYVERNLKEVPNFSPDFTINYPEELLSILY